MSLFGIEAGPYLGDLLNRLAELQGAGEITTRDEAIVAVEAFLKEDGALC
jgi:hypothetical protein